MVEIVIAVLGSSVLTVIVNRVFNILYRKKDKKDQIIYEFSKKEINSNINDYVKISYEGQLDKNKSKQNITITNVEKLDKEFTLESLNNNNTKNRK